MNLTPKSHRQPNDLHFCLWMVWAFFSAASISNNDYVLLVFCSRHRSRMCACACFHLNCWCLLPRIMSFLWISPVCVLFCCRTEWDMLDEAISLKIKRNVTACVEYVCMSQEEMMCPDVVVPLNMHLWWKFRPDMDSYEYITQTEYANNIVRNNEMTCH